MVKGCCKFSINFYYPCYSAFLDNWKQNTDELKTVHPSFPSRYSGKQNIKQEYKNSKEQQLWKITYVRKAIIPNVYLWRYNSYFYTEKIRS